jgi:DNA-3-methyladenine glycosylase
LLSRVDGVTTSGRIVETEAYLGPEDAASHAAFRPSSRTLFYGPGGVAYVFRAYGLHFCLNAIAGPRGTPGCVLIRALEPLRGIAVMARRRGLDHRAGTTGKGLADGPAKLTQALGITLDENGIDLTEGRLVIQRGPRPRSFGVSAGRRVGISRARDLPLRFWVRDSPFVSGPRPTGTDRPVRAATRASPSRRSPRTPRPRA